ncbi:Processing alpha glucosidase I [Lecanora helva]
MTLQRFAREPKDIVIIGGGAIGCSIAYFLTHHALYDQDIHRITLLEASSIAGGSSGKAGGLLAEWATPKCLAPLSFKTHAQLAQKHEGDKVWGHREVYCAEVKLQAQNATSYSQEKSTTAPSALDWLLAGVIRSYDEVGNLSNSGQVNPYMYTTTLAKLAEDNGTKIVYGSAKKLKYKENNQGIQSVTYTDNEKMASHELAATDVVIAAGPWTPNIFPSVQLGAPRGHGVVVRPSRNLSPYVLFPKIQPPLDGTLSNILSPKIYPRPGDGLYKFDTVYACGPDDYTVPLPEDTSRVQVDKQKTEDVWTAIERVSGEIRDGEVITRQACYKSQIRPHEEDEEVGPIVGPAGIVGVWLATGHDEWGIQNSAGTGLVMSEMIMEGRAKSANCEALDPKHFLKDAA